MENEKNLHLDGQTFEAMRNDADQIIQAMMKDMTEKGSERGKLNISIEVELEDASAVDRETGEIRQIFIPRFKHSISSAIQIKNRASGSYGGHDIELAYDDTSDEYIVKQLANMDQMSIFDDDMREFMDDHRNELPDELRPSETLDPAAEPAAEEPAEEPADVDSDETASHDEVEPKEPEKNPFGEPEEDEFDEIDGLV